MKKKLRLSCRRGFKLFAALAGALDAGGLAFQIAEVVQTGASDMALARNLDGGDGGRMERKYALYAGAKADAAHGEGGARRATLFGDDHAFKGLDAFFDLVAFAFKEADVDLDRVARAEVGQIFAQLRFMEFANRRIHFSYSLQDPLGRGQLV